jgi:ribonuclease HI
MDRHSTLPVQLQAELWTMYFDRSLMKTRAGVGLLFISPLGVHMRYVIRLHFLASNNVAEYEALIMGLRIAIELGVRHLDVRGDSELVINQVMKNSSCSDPKMEAYCEEVWCLENKFHGLELNHIARRYNEAADELAKIASDIFTKDLQQPSVDLGSDRGVDGPSLAPPPMAEAPSTGAEAMQVEGLTPPSDPEPDWRVPYLDHLIRGDLPSDRTEA